MKFNVTDIKWDTESGDVVYTAEELELPLETIIEADDEDGVADALSDKFNFCIHSFGSAIPLKTSNDEGIKKINQFLRNVRHELLCLDVLGGSVASLEVEELIESTEKMLKHLKESTVEISRSTS
jgi:hypothetical protein